MIDRKLFEFQMKKQRIYIDRRGLCEVCGRFVLYSDYQLAHRIPKTKFNLKMYGPEVIHHPMNLALTCGLRCNAAVNINHKPIEKQRLIDEIEELL